VKGVLCKSVNVVSRGKSGRSIHWQARSLFYIAASEVPVPTLGIDEYDLTRELSAYDDHLLSSEKLV
jgi:hypothetical protein